MVLHVSSSVAPPVKGLPQTTLANDCPGWDTPPMLGNFQPSLQLPYQHYALIYLDNTGKLRVQESRSIQEQNDTVFSPDVQQRFLEILGPKIGYHRPMVIRQGSTKWRHRDDYHSWPPSRLMKRCRSVSHSSFHDSFSDSVEELPPYSPTDMIELEIGDTEKVIAYYENALKRFQQLNCRNIAKAFIKAIEPRKQVRYPYNGGRTGNPELTKPAWWPPGVIHKEPDHLKMEYRIPLLMHILRNLGEYGVTSDKLREVAHDSKKTLQEGGIEILDEVFRVRKLEERYERNEVDASTKVYVFNYNSNSSKRRKASRPVSELDHDDDVADTCGFLTPSSSVDHAPGPMTTSMDSMAMVAHSRPMQLQSDRDQLFQMPGTLGFDGQTRQDHRPYYPASTEYSDFPASTAATGVINQTEPVGLDYLTQATFPTPGPEAPISPQSRHASMPMQSPPNQFQQWNVRSSVFGSMDFASTPGQTIPQVTMPYQIPVSGSTSHVQMSHSLPQLPRGNAHPGSLSMRNPPFRTGSFSHPHTIQQPLHSESLRVDSANTTSTSKDS